MPLTFFVQTIGHNSINAHWISIKTGTKIEPFMCAKLQLNQSMHALTFYGQVCKICEKKEKPEILVTHILETAWVIFPLNLVCLPLQLNWFHLDKTSRSYVKSRFLSFCQYTHGVVCQLLVPHNTLTVCPDVVP